MNPGLMGLYVEKWMDNEQVKETGYKVLHKNKFTCSSCKVQSPPAKGECEHGWLVPVDPEHAAFAVRDENDGIVLCPVCLAAASLNHSTSPGNVRGSLIYAPGFTQAQISRLAIMSRVASMVLEQSDPARQMVVDIELAFGGGQMREELRTDKAYGGSESDYAFAVALASLSDEAYKMRDNALQNIKFWPAGVSFSEFYQHLSKHNPNFNLKKLVAASQKLIASEQKQQKKSKKENKQEEASDSVRNEAPF